MQLSRQQTHRGGQHSAHVPVRAKGREERVINVHHERQSREGGGHCVQQKARLRGGKGRASSNAATRNYDTR